jgi:hypothetical protein
MLISRAGSMREVKVAVHGADGDDLLAIFHELAHVFVHQLAVIHSDVGGMLFVEHGFIHEHRGEGQP